MIINFAKTSSGKKGQIANAATAGHNARTEARPAGRGPPVPSFRRRFPTAFLERSSSTIYVATATAPQALDGMLLRRVPRAPVGRQRFRRPGKTDEIEQRGSRRSRFDGPESASEKIRGARGSPCCVPSSDRSAKPPKVSSVASIFARSAIRFGCDPIPSLVVLPTIQGHVLFLVRKMNSNRALGPRTRKSRDYSPFL